MIKHLNNTIVLLEKLYEILPKDEFVKACENISFLVPEAQVAHYGEDLKRHLAQNYHLEYGTIFHYLLCKNKLEMLDLLLTEKRIGEGLNEKLYRQQGGAGDSHLHDSNVFSYPISLNNPAIFDLYEKKGIKMKVFRDLEICLSNFTHDYHTRVKFTKEEFKTLWKKFLPFANQFMQYEWTNTPNKNKKNAFLDKFLNEKINPHYKLFLCNAIENKQYNVFWAFLEIYPEIKINNDFALNLVSRFIYNKSFEQVNLFLEKFPNISLHEKFKKIEESFRKEEDNSLDKILNTLSYSNYSSNIMYDDHKTFHTPLNNQAVNQFLNKEFLQHHFAAKETLLEFSLQTLNKELFENCMEVFKINFKKTNLYTTNIFEKIVLFNPEQNNMKNLLNKFGKLTEAYPEVFQKIIEDTFNSYKEIEEKINNKKNNYASDKQRQHADNILQAVAFYYHQYPELIENYPEKIINAVESIILKENYPVSKIKKILKL